MSIGIPPSIPRTAAAPPSRPAASHAPGCRRTLPDRPALAGNRCPGVACLQLPRYRGLRLFSASWPHPQIPSLLLISRIRLDVSPVGSSSSRSIMLYRFFSIACSCFLVLIVSSAGCAGPALSQPASHERRRGARPRDEGSVSGSRRYFPATSGLYVGC